MIANLMQMLSANKAPTPPSKEPLNAFAAQNGLGQKAEIFSADPRASGAQNAWANQKNGGQQNPMTAMLNLLTGSAPSDGGMMSMLPALMNLFKGAPAGQDAPKTAPQPTEQDMSESERNNCQIRQNGYETESSSKPDHGQNIAEKQPKKFALGEDKFQPVTFAGYALVSALNKLYSAKSSAKYRR